MLLRRTRQTGRGITLRPLGNTPLGRSGIITLSCLDRLDLFLRCLCNRGSRDHQARSDQGSRKQKYPHEFLPMLVQPCDLMSVNATELNAPGQLMVAPAVVTSAALAG